MAFYIDTKTYDKRWQGVGNGWDYRPNGKKPSSMIIHSTNGNRYSSFAGEANFIRNSKAIGAHFLVGKYAEIAQCLPPELRAHHAGVTIEGFFNSDSIGIETHFTPGELWTSKGTEALTWLVQNLMQDFDIPILRIETHRKVALPAGRKSDPSQWSDQQFYDWRSGLLQSTLRADIQVIGVSPSSTLDQWSRSILRNGAVLSEVERNRLYQRCRDYEIEPSFVLSIMKHEGDFGRSPLQRITNNPFNVRAEGEDDRPSYVDEKGNRWLKFESYNQGLEYGLIHLKWIYGSAGLLRIDQIIPVFAPASDGNSPLAYIEAVLTDMKYIQNN